MQRHKSVEKRARQNKKANIANRMHRNTMKTAIRNVLEAKDKATAEKAFQVAVSILDKSAKSGLIHKNNAANKKSRLSRVVAKIGK
jgi:small subunit ribosomal protein S20